MSPHPSPYFSTSPSSSTPIVEYYCPSCASLPLPSTTKQANKEILDTTPSTIQIMVHQSPTTRPTTLIVLVNDNMHIITDTTPTTTLTPFPAVIRRALRENELGKFVLMMSVPMTIGMFTIINLVSAAATTMHVAAVSLSIGFVGIWNGILLRGVMDRTSTLLEAFGIAFVLLSFFGFIACFLPLNVFWVPLLCWTLSIAVFLAAAFRSRSGSQPDNAAAPAPESPRSPV